MMRCYLILCSLMLQLLQGLSNMINCKESTFFVPGGLGPDCKFKVVIATTGKLKTNKWAPIYRIEVIGKYIGGFIEPKK